MSAAKHTPGPWEVGDLDHACQRVVRQEHIEICTCWHHSVGSIEREMEANARLIAAAPDMLNMLRECRATFAYAAGDGDGEAYQFVDQIDAVLAKAEGRS